MFPPYAQDGSKGFIIVNNSGTIEVIDMKTMESLAQLQGWILPAGWSLSEKKRIKQPFIG